VNWVLTTSFQVRLPTQLSRLEIAQILFPTLVLGGDAQNRILIIGLPEVLKWIDLAFSKQTAASTSSTQETLPNWCDIYWSSRSQGSHQFVLGQERLTVNQAIAEICLFKQKNLLSHSPSLPLANLLFYSGFRWLLGIGSLRNPHFT